MKGENRIGERHFTNEGYEIEIIEYFDSTNATVVFKDGGIINRVRYSDILRGKVKNKNHRGVFEVGYFGYGEYKAHVDKNRTVCYEKWKSMIERCYNKKSRHKHPTYKDVIVCEDWHNFQNFAKWFYKNSVEGFALDKDILVKNNKIYSPETCCFVPQEINQLFVISKSKRKNLPLGVNTRGNKFYSSFSKYNKYQYLGTFDTPEQAFQSYKVAKEQYIKEIIKTYKNILNEKVYQILYNYQIEITD